MLFWLFNEHHVTPGNFYTMPEGEKEILRAFYDKTMENRREIAL